MKWYQDFANVMALISVPVGLALIFWSNEIEFGKYLLAGAFGVGIKSISTRVPMGKVAPLIIVALLLCGCVAPMVPPNIAATIEKVCDRHDSYVDNDPLLTTLKQITYIEDTDIIRAFLNASKEPE